MSANITVIGTVATEPKLLRFENGGTKATFRLAESERWLDRTSGEWTQGATSWYTINASRTLAENTVCSLKKGDRVILTGKMRHRKWESQDGRTGYSAEVDVEGLGHDLRFGTSHFVKANAQNGWSANLQSAQLQSAQLQSAQLQSAQLQSAQLQSAQLSVAGWQQPETLPKTQSTQPAIKAADVVKVPASAAKNS